MVIGSVNPTSLAILKPPGEWGAKGADIACGDCQPLGVPLSSGGPYAGFLTTKNGIRAPDAGPHRRPHGRRQRSAGLRAHAAGARAAHPPRQGDVEHLHEPGLAGHGRHDLPQLVRAGRPGARGERIARAHQRAGRGAHARQGREARVRSAALPRGGAAARSPGRARASRSSRVAASSAASICRSTIRSSAMRCWSAPPRRARTPTSRPTPTHSPKPSKPPCAPPEGERTHMAMQKHPEKIIFEYSRPGRGAFGQWPTERDTPNEIAADIPEALRRKKPAMLPEVSELEVVRHFTKLSQLNFSIDTHFYPLGSCTMKYNPKACNSVRHAAGFPQPPSAGAGLIGPGLPRLHVRTAGDAQGSHRHAGRGAVAHGRRARRIRRRRHDPRVSPRARRSRPQRNHRARSRRTAPIPPPPPCAAAW